MGKPIKLKCKPSEQIGEILKQSKPLKEGKELSFKTTIGIVKVKKNKVRLTFYFDNKTIPKSSLTAMLRGKESKPAKNQKQIDKTAKRELLLTQAQLDRKYKTSNFIYALESTQYGKKKQRRKLTETLKGVKKLKGSELMKHTEAVYGLVPTYDFFTIFERMDRLENGKLLEL